MKEDTFAKRVADNGMHKDARDYQALKEAHEREIEAIRTIYERKVREFNGDREAAKRAVAAMGHNIALLK